MRASIQLLVSVLSFSLLPLGALAAQNGGPPAGAPPAGGARPQMQIGPPKNLQVLPKDITTDELVKTMRGFTGALGVNCTFCHATAGGRPDFASDANPNKAIARTMITMTKDINQKYLASIAMPNQPTHVDIECGNCHQGHNVPQPFVPPAPAPRPQGGAAPPPPPPGM